MHWLLHRNLTSAPYSRRAGINCWSIIITAYFNEQTATSVFMYSYLSLASLFPWFSQYSLNQNVFWQKGLGVSHNSPQADKVLPWSIQLSKNNIWKGLFSLHFPICHKQAYLLPKKVKEVKLPFTLHKENLTSLVTEILNFFDKFLQLF